ncbi:Serine/threonine protein kinase [Nonomuraea solani]|uniref:Serine/threonine protein kinase n=1 Tax=Nonomuraea solani TaxID=1144553 RepID=A0A1H6EL30_9ACTN|nr:serine/threonine-protein kinase [Nonomuraea solani]SEG97811.1 Serine/threonine protein kinase [Nonomuraea solani]
MPDFAALVSGDPQELGGLTLLGRLGQGGQGVVYLAKTPMGAQVAIKWLSPSDDEGGVERFLREAEIARRVAPFCTATVLSTGVAQGRPYIMSEYVEGRSLDRFVREDGPLAGGGLEQLAIGTATALAAIHAVDVVHRDFKPGNVIMGPGGPRVIDFGIARVLTPATMTSSTQIGTPAYMAPEQIEGQGLGPAADIFSWGGTMVYASCGRAPFGSAGPHTVMKRVLTEEPDLGSLEGRLRDLVRRCLAKDPSGRPTAMDVITSLLRNPAPGADPLAEGTKQATPGTGPPAGSHAAPSVGPQAGLGAAPQAGSGAAPSVGPQAGSGVSRPAGPETAPQAALGAGSHAGPPAAPQAGPRAAPSAGPQAGSRAASLGGLGAGSSAGLTKPTRRPVFIGVGALVAAVVVAAVIAVPGWLRPSAPVTPQAVTASSAAATPSRQATPDTPVETTLPGGSIKLFERPSDRVALLAYELYDKKLDEDVDYARRSPRGEFDKYSGNLDSYVSPNGRYLAGRPHGYTSDGYDSILITDRQTGSSFRIKTVHKPMDAPIRGWSRDGTKFLLNINRKSKDKKGETVWRTVGFGIVDVAAHDVAQSRLRLVEDVADDTIRDSDFGWDEREEGVVIEYGDDEGLRFFDAAGKRTRDISNAGPLASGTLDLFSPSGKTFVTDCPGGADGDHCLWDSATGRQVRRFSSDCDKILGWYDESRLYCWEEDNGAHDEIRVVAFDGKLLHRLLEVPDKLDMSPYFTITPTSS